MYRVAIADEHPFARHALRTWMHEQGFEVVAETGDGLDAVWQVQAESPDLLVLGLRLTRLNGIEVARRLRQHASACRVLVFTDQPTQHTAGLCARAGASGFVSKSDGLDELALAIEAIRRGKTFFPLQGIQRPNRDPATRTEAEQLDQLSPRELTVLRYLAQGMGNRAIADEMMLSDRTVSTYKSRIQEKLNVKSVIELAAIAARHGLGFAPIGDAERPARAEVEQARRLLDAMPVSMTVRDREGGLRFANRYTRERAAFPTGGKERVGLGELSELDDDQRADLIDAFHASVATRTPYRREFLLRHGGRAVAIVHWGAPICDEQGTVLAMLCYAQDIEALDTAFVTLRDAHARALAFGAARSALLLRTARELGAWANALNSTDPEQAAGRAERAQIGIARLQREIERHVVAGAHAGAGPERVDPAQEARSALMPFRDECAVAGISLTAEYGAENPPVWLDVASYRQLLSGLLSHAIRMRDARTVRLRWSAARRSRGMLLIRIAVTVGPEAAVDLAPEDLQLWREVAETLQGALASSDEGRSVLLTVPAALALV